MTTELATEKKQYLMEVFKSKNIIESHFLPDVNNDAKHDIELKKATFIVGVSSFLQEPINMMVKGESSVGKTHTVKTVLSYFPQKSVLYIGKASRTSFYHDNGILMNANGQIIDADKEPIKPIKKTFKNEQDYEEAKANYEKAKKNWNAQLRESYTLIDLEHKIMFFMETHNEVYVDLLPVLSHDKKEIEFNFTDKTSKGSLRTKHVKVRGYPSAIFLMTEKQELQRMDELSTRSLTLSPDATDEKFADANKMATQKSCRKWERASELPVKKGLCGLIEAIQNAFIEKPSYETILPFENLNELYPHSEARDMRDFNHFIQCVESSSALHIHQRVIAKINGKKYAVSSVQDVNLAFDMFSKIFESTRSNMNKTMTDFYWNYCSRHGGGFTIRDMTNFYNETNPHKKYSKKHFMSHNVCSLKKKKMVSYFLKRACYSLSVFFDFL